MWHKVVETKSAADFEKELNVFSEKPNINVKFTQTKITVVPDNLILEKGYVLYTAIIYYETNHR